MKLRILLPDVAVVVVADEYAGLVPRLAEAFRRAWDQIPPADRGVMLGAWRGTRGGRLFVKMAGRMPCPWGDAWGWCRSRSRVDLDGEAVRQLSDDMVTILIAHELGHCCERCQHGRSDEAGADRIAEGWGFNMAGLRRQPPTAVSRERLT